MDAGAKRSLHPSCNSWPRFCTQRPQRQQAAEASANATASFGRSLAESRCRPAATSRSWFACHTFRARRKAAFASRSSLFEATAAFFTFDKGSHAACLATDTSSCTMMAPVPNWELSPMLSSTGISLSMASASSSSGAAAHGLTGAANTPSGTAPVRESAHEPD